MNNKKIKIGILVIAMIVLIAPKIILAQQDNDYKAFLVYQYIDTNKMYGTNVTMNSQVVYVPTYPSTTYTLTYQYKLIMVDVSNPSTINDQIEQGIKSDGNYRGYNVTKVYIPSYESKYDAWKYVILNSNFTTSSNTSVPITGLSFTPIPNTKYEVEVEFMVRSPILATVEPRLGLNWPTGLIDGTAFIQAPSLQTVALSNCNIELPCISPVGGLTTTTGSYGGFIKSIFGTGDNPSGDFHVTLASETEGTNVMMMRGSFLKYRVVS